MATPGGGPADDPRETSPYAGLPTYESYLSADGDRPLLVHRYECGECGVPSRYVREYSLLTIICLLFAVAWQVDEMAKCPRCMRWHIIVRLPLAILLSNLLSPVVVIWWLFMFVKTFVRPF